jgi:hypothetical protein
VSIGWRQVRHRAGLEALEKSKISAHGSSGIKAVDVILVTFVSFLTKITVVNSNVGTDGKRGSKCKH